MSPPCPLVLQHGNQVHFLLGKQRRAFDLRDKGRRAECAMRLGLVFLAVLAMLVSCEDPEGNRVFGEEGFTGCPALLAPGWTGLRQQRARPLSCPVVSTGEVGAGLHKSWVLLEDALLTTAGCELR